MNMKKCCRRLALVALSLVAFGVAGAGTSFHGVINPNSHSVWVDTVIVSSVPPADTFATTGWGSDSVAMDTFDFPNLIAWPSQVELKMTIDGLRMGQMFLGPVNGVWYDFMPVPPPPPKVMFYGETGVEESRATIEPRLRLSISPSVLVDRVTIQAQVAGRGPARLEIVDAAGNRVRSFCTNDLDRVITQLWLGDDDAGQRLPEGIYFCRLAAGQTATARKLILTR